MEEKASQYETWPHRLRGLLYPHGNLKGNRSGRKEVTLEHFGVFCMYKIERRVLLVFMIQINVL